MKPILQKIQKIITVPINFILRPVVWLLSNLGKLVLWIKYLFTAKAELTYWIDGVEHRAIIRDFTEKNTHSFQYVDWKTKRISLVKTAEPVSYKITELDRHSS